MGFTCPSCGFDNFLGEDRCVQCLHSLMQRDIPRPKKNDEIQSAMMTAPVSDLLTGQDLLVATADDAVAKIVSIFQKKNKKCVLVYKKKKLVGILSTRDLLKKVARRGNDLSKVRVEQVMTPNPEFVRAEDPIAAAVHKMALGGFRNLPVLNAEGAPLTIVSMKDVLSYLSRRK